MSSGAGFRAEVSIAKDKRDRPVTAVTGRDIFGNKHRG
jgi:hypothetical protein